VWIDNASRRETRGLTSVGGRRWRGSTSRPSPDQTNGAKTRADPEARGNRRLLLRARLEALGSRNWSSKTAFSAKLGGRIMPIGGKMGAAINSA